MSSEDNNNNNTSSSSNGEQPKKKMRRAEDPVSPVFTFGDFVEIGHDHFTDDLCAKKFVGHSAEYHVTPQKFWWYLFNDKFFNDYPTTRLSIIKTVASRYGSKYLPDVVFMVPIPGTSTLHLTVNYIERARISDIFEVVKHYKEFRLFSRATVSIGSEPIGVGQNGATRAYPLLFKRPADQEKLASLYRYYSRRAGNEFPELLFHVTTKNRDDRETEVLKRRAQTRDGWFDLTPQQSTGDSGEWLHVKVPGYGTLFKIAAPKPRDGPGGATTGKHPLFLRKCKECKLHRPDTPQWFGNYEKKYVGDEDRANAQWYAALKKLYHACDSCFTTLWCK